ncbi:MAG: prolyl oligopeptidase family serine peptidase [Asticcacaulis sp.]
MSRKTLLILATALVTQSLVLGAAVTPALAQDAETRKTDAFIWLEEVYGPKALDWVKDQNQKTETILTTDKRYPVFRDQALKIFTAKDRIAWPSHRAGMIDNVWQDDTHIKGVWRQTSRDAYAQATPTWTTLLDLDALSKAEGVNWVWKGAACLDPAETRCLLRLSDGGKDAVTVREFDTTTKSFVRDGFVLPEGKQNLTWLDQDTILIARDWGTGSMTESGYPFVLKSLKRGQPLDQATELFRGTAKDVQVSPRVLRHPDGSVAAVMATRGVSFFESEHYLITDKGAAKLPFPARVNIEALIKGQLVFVTRQAWSGFKAGDVLAYDLAALKADPASAKPTLIFTPAANQAVAGVATTQNHIVVNLLEDVKGAVDIYAFKDGRWSAERLPLPANQAFGLGSTSGSTDLFFLSGEGFLNPTTLYQVDAAARTVAPLKALPPRFNADNQVVEQFFATSKDGTRVPYFVVRPKGLKFDGKAATIQFGYGGFQISKPPAYIPEMGKLWLERGGVFVIANIRGGGEYGPAWHQAALKENRQRAFDDFHAVAEDLIRRKITAPKHLGIYGRSNGGVLTSVAITQRPDLYNAAVIESPLVDMQRYHLLPAGASWVGEYGNPEIPEQAAYIKAYNGYSNLKLGVRYPVPYVTTNTKDDRVHPGHARKFAAKMQAMGYSALYHENTDGGHSNDSDPVLNAERWARHYVYLSQRLMD